MVSNKMKMGRDEKQYNFIDDRNEEYFVGERVTEVNGLVGGDTHQTIQ
jgi:hypothetical protein